jgi:hypothetical protein
MPPQRMTLRDRRIVEIVRTIAHIPSRSMTGAGSSLM